MCSTRPYLPLRIRSALKQRCKKCKIKGSLSFGCAQEALFVDINHSPVVLLHATIITYLLGHTAFSILLGRALGLSIPQIKAPGHRCCLRATAAHRAAGRDGDEWICSQSAPRGQEEPRKLVNVKYFSKWLSYYL